MNTNHQHESRTLFNQSPFNHSPNMDELKLRFISWIGRFLVVTIGKSLRIMEAGQVNTGRAIYAFWHGDLFPLIYVARFQDVTVLVSTHRDGEYIARIIEPLGYKVVRGSSASDGMKGFWELLKSDKDSFAIAPDGPKGPRHQVKDGILRLAKLTGLPIIPVGIGISRKVRFGSWDRFNLPLPFSRCIIYWGPPIWVKNRRSAEVSPQPKWDVGNKSLETALISASIRANSFSSHFV